MKKRLISMILSVSMLFGCFSLQTMASSTELTQTVYACADGYYNTSGGVMVWSGETDRLGVSNTGTNPYRMSYLKFDMADIRNKLSDGLEIVSATVVLTAKFARDYGVEGSDGYLSLYSIEDDRWTEDGTITPTYITAENQAELCVSTDPQNPDNNYILIPDGGAAGDKFYIDITDHVIKTAADEDDGYMSLEASWVVERKGGNTFNFNSIENGNQENWPQLRIEYADSSTVGVSPNSAFEPGHELAAIADGSIRSYTSGDQAGQTYYQGDGDTLAIREKKGAFLHSSFLKFDISDVNENIRNGAEIKDATVRVRVSKIYHSTDESLSLYELSDDSWSDTVSPPLRDRADLVPISKDPENPDSTGVTISLESAGEYLELDITDALIAETSSGYDNYISMEMAFTSDSSYGNMLFYSKEYREGINPPKLFVNYSEVSLDDASIEVDGVAVAAPTEGENSLEAAFSSTYNTTKKMTPVWAVYKVDGNSKELEYVSLDTVYVPSNSTYSYNKTVSLPLLSENERYEAKFMLLDSNENLNPLLKNAEFKQSELGMPSVFASDAVLQRDVSLPVWGRAYAGAPVTVSLDGKIYETTADSKGDWSVSLEPVKLSDEAYTMTVSSGDSTITYDNLLAGDVWICAGQSNMEFALYRTDNADSDIAEAENYSQIRLFSQDKCGSKSNAYDVQNGIWQVCSSDSVKSFSAVGYLFAKELTDDLDVPIGLINASYGGAPAESFTSTEALSESDLSHLLDLEFDDTNRNPGRIFNAMVEPLIPYSVKGVIWYQGEANHRRYSEYAALQGVMLDDWRERWGYDFPFVYTQLTAFGGTSGDCFPELREAQRSFLDMSTNTQMAVIMDCGNETDIHPTDKTPVAHRLALCAKKIAYDMDDVQYKFPEPESFAVSGASVTITYDEVYDGLYTTDNADLTGFELCGTDGVYYSATAVVNSDNTITVSSESVAEPVGIAYGYAPYPSPELNLYNSAGLIATPFIHTLS